VAPPVALLPPLEAPPPGVAFPPLAIMAPAPPVGVPESVELQAAAAHAQLAVIIHVRNRFMTCVVFRSELLRCARSLLRQQLQLLAPTSGLRSR